LTSIKYANGTHLSEKGSLMKNCIYRKSTVFADKSTTRPWLL